MNITQFSLRFSLSLFLLACGLSAVAEDALPIQLFKNLAAGQKQTVVVYGTSLTHGGEWAKEMKRWFDKQYPEQVTFINSGGPGQTSDWGRANLKKKVLEQRPDLVFIEFSYNDAHEKFKMPVKQGWDNLDFMVRSIREQNEHVSIVLQIMNKPWDAPGDRRPAGSRSELETFNDNYRRYAKEHALPLIDHYPAWQKLEQTDAAKFHKWLPDGSHPTAEASLAITWPPIQKMFERTRLKATEKK